MGLLVLNPQGENSPYMVSSQVGDGANTVGLS